MIARIVSSLAVLCGVTPSSPAEPARPRIEAQNILALQHERDDKATGRYDWGSSVMLDGDLYRMWWVRLGGTNKQRFPYATTLADGTRFEFTYPDWGDRIYCAESRDGRQWRLDGADYAGPRDRFSPDADGPLMVLAPAETDQERNHVGTPSVIKVAGIYYMYYEAPSEFVCTRQADGRVTVGNEYQNQIFVATSRDGKDWHKHPDDRRPQPIIRAPAENKRLGRQRYGLGQPSVFHRNGRFVMHYVDSCTGPGDFIVRIEADNPFFKGAGPFGRALQPGNPATRVPVGSVARFAQADVKFLGETFYLLRPVYESGCLGILATRDGVFEADADARHPTHVFPKIDVPDPRGPQYRERISPRFFTNPEGEILVRNGRVALYYGSGLCGKENAYTWNLYRCEAPLADIPVAQSSASTPAR